MKLFFSLLFFFALSSLSVAQKEKFVVVSDYDDTFRITGHKTLPKVWNGLMTDRIYAGADMLYQALQRNAQALYFVSNTPEMMRRIATRRIKGYQLNPDSVFLFHGDGEKFDYKMASVKWVLKAHPDCKLILLGDNATADHLVYDSIRTLFPKRVLQIYIRPVKVDKPIPQKIQEYYTAFEIAHLESEAGRIASADAKKVGAEILKSKKRGLAPSVLKLPPKRIVVKGKDDELNELQEQVFDYLWSLK